MGRNKKLTKVTAFWVFMNALRIRKDSTQTFQVFADAHHSEWTSLTREEKNFWQKKAKRIEKSVIYQEMFLELECKINRMLEFYRALTRYMIREFVLNE